MAGYDDRERDDRDRDKLDRDDRGRDDEAEGEDSGRGRRRALQQVKPPAIGMLVGGIFFILAALYGMVNILLQKDQFIISFQQQQGQAGQAGKGPDAEAIYGMYLVVGVIVTVLAVVIGGLIIFGALQMMNLKSYGLVMTACILGMLPCSICCLLSLPMGIWSLVTINNAEVKPYFR